MSGCQLVFNELCLLRPASSLEEARYRMVDLVRLVRHAMKETGAKGLCVTTEFSSLALGPDGYSFRQWRSDNAVDEPARRILDRAIDKRERLSEQSDPLEVLAEWKARGVEAVWRGQPAQGLFAAFLADSLAVSLPVESWNRAKVEIQVLRGKSVENSVSITVRHAACSEHLAEYSESWLQRSEDALAWYRREVDPWKADYIHASKYSSRKHVRGRDNAARQKAANKAGAAGQFVAEHEGGKVTDHEIASWERAALVEAWLGEGEAAVSRHDGGRTFFVISERCHPVGFVGGSGRETCLLRVEWSSGSVHSHPRDGR